MGVTMPRHARGEPRIKNRVLALKTGQPLFTQFDKMRLSLALGDKRGQLLRWDEPQMLPARPIDAAPGQPIAQVHTRHLLTRRVAHRSMRKMAS